MPTNELPGVLEFSVTEVAEPDFQHIGVGVAFQGALDDSIQAFQRLRVDAARRAPKPAALQAEIRTL